MQATLRDRMSWGRMRMSPRDIADVTGHTYSYLMNGLHPQANWTGLFKPGERVWLRVINASAMTYFNIRIPGLPMTVVAADGKTVEPVETDEFQIAVSETFGVIVEPSADRAYTIMAETMDRSGYARGTLAPRVGIVAPVPALREQPQLTMVDMGMDMNPMDMGGMDMGRSQDQMPTDHGSMEKMAGMGHGRGGHEMAGMSRMPHGTQDMAHGTGAMAGSMGAGAVRRKPARSSPAMGRIITGRAT